VGKVCERKEEGEVKLMQEYYILSGYKRKTRAVSLARAVSSHALSLD
jgi:hypothetical protein